MKKKDPTLEQIGELLAILGDEAQIYAIIREDCEELARKYGADESDATGDRGLDDVRIDAERDRR